MFILIIKYGIFAANAAKIFDNQNEESFFRISTANIGTLLSATRSTILADSNSIEPFVKLTHVSFILVSWVVLRTITIITRNKKSVETSSQVLNPRFAGVVTDITGIIISDEMGILYKFGGICQGFVPARRDQRAF